MFELMLFPINDEYKEGQMSFVCAEYFEDTNGYYGTYETVDWNTAGKKMNEQ